ncbi:hypothetical protein [Corynebacterium lizhenjunii]|uniref:hypothetical protein n=1 Tax=Corynebacterium lizhenjunii TaxID=2709394 RepID=UPI0013EDB7F9|nr:hypothetical protein [Corynebacterium lizhenjunii]
MSTTLTPEQQEQIGRYEARALSIFERLGIPLDNADDISQEITLAVCKAVELFAYWGDYELTYRSPYIKPNGRPYMKEKITISMEGDTEIKFNTRRESISKVVKRIQDMPRIMEEIENGNH